MVLTALLVLSVRGADAICEVKVTNPPESSRTFSGWFSHTKDVDKSSMLDGRMGWQPDTPVAAGQWMQIDAGSEVTLAGVVTQGFNHPVRNANTMQWLTMFGLKTGIVSSGSAAYYITNKQKYCPEGSDLTTEVDCRTAAAALGTALGAVIRGTHNHHHCFFIGDGHGVYFNAAPRAGQPIVERTLTTHLPPFESHGPVPPCHRLTTFQASRLLGLR